MILSRVIRHLKHQHWTAIFLDFVIVVLGVFIGIQVSNWNAERAESRTEAQYLAMLRRDLQSTLTDVKAQIAFERFQAEQANVAVRLIHQTPSEERNKKLAVICSQLTTRRTMRIESPTFVDLQSSGKLGIISDQKLRNDIVSYFYRIRRWEAVIDKNNEVFVDRDFTDAMLNLGVGFRTWDAELMKTQLPWGNDGYDELVRARLGERLGSITSAALMSPPGAAIWIGVEQQLSWRAGVAATNESFASGLLDATANIENAINRYLEGVRR